MNPKDTRSPSGESDHSVEYESDHEADTTLNPPRTSQKLTAQNKLFEELVTLRAASNETYARETLQQTADEKLSVTSLMAKQEALTIIGNPRDYQTELFERAKTQNTIAVLDTGSGKTLVAVLLLQFVHDQEQEDRGQGKPRRISFFLVDSVNLVYQQGAVLETNLPYKIAQFCGSMGIDLWQKSVWEKHFHEHEIVVCTAEILVQCLMHSFIKIDQINLLIFDEAHHAKKNHAYARIIKDFYLAESDHSKRPRIFGMTASPVDAKVDVVRAAMELETLLHSRIATTSDLTLLQRCVSRPSEEVALYSELVPQFQTALTLRLTLEVGQLQHLQVQFTKSMEISSHLGRWCADMYWVMALGDVQKRRIEMQAEVSHQQQAGNDAGDSLQHEISLLRRAADIVRTYDIGIPRLDAGDLSSKVLVLHRWLMRFFETPSDDRCIVFVEQKYTAKLLFLLFQHVGGKHLRPGVLVGSGSGSTGDGKHTFRQQLLRLLQFKKGEVNCLFSTSVAEEGLDVPDCNLVVRFDLAKTMIQYVQSRGRARHRKSWLVHFLEKGNVEHQNLLLEARKCEATMRSFCESLPADRLLSGNEDDFGLDGLLIREKDYRCCVDPSSGAKLTYNSALGVLARFVAALPRNSEGTLHPHYVVTSTAGAFVGEVLLPEGSPLRSAVGRPHKTKSAAKRSAAFEACRELRVKRLLDANFLPIYAKRLPEMRNALLALTSKRSSSYGMRIKPRLWERTRGSRPDLLYATVLDFPQGLERPHQPLAFLTRTPLPDLPSFPIYLKDGRSSMLATIKLRSPFLLHGDMLDQFTTFTLRIFLDLFNKTYTPNPAAMSYWLIPVFANVSITPDSHLWDILDLPAVEDVAKNEEYKWAPGVSNDFLTNKLLVDRWDGARRFFSVALAPQYQPLDPVPPNTAKGEHNKNILDYTVSLFKNARAKAVWSTSQPVIQADKVLVRRNMLEAPDGKEKELISLCFLCPEPLRISSIPSTVACIAYTFPAIIHRFESYLISLEAFELLGLDVTAELALEAVTKDSDNTGEHRDEQIDFQGGMGANYERLEFLGDCFLKMATSISIFCKRPNDNEFEFHVRRMLLICNQNLFKTAKDMELYQYIRSKAFNRRTWYPEGLEQLGGKRMTKTQEENYRQHALADKSIADVCEAIIGASYLRYTDIQEWSPEHWDSAVKAVSILVNSPDHDMQRWADYKKAYEEPAFLSTRSLMREETQAREIEKAHDYRFRSPQLLQCAFTHPSWPFIWGKVPSYQRLEFLGDALLDMVCVAHLFHQYPTKDPQWLTEHKMAMVSNKFLGAICVKLGFDKYIRHHQDGLGIQKQEYAQELKEAEHEAKGAVDYWTNLRQPPKCLPDIVEAYVGAMFVDSDFDFKVVQKFFDLHIKPYFEDMKAYDAYANSGYVNRLHQLLGTRFGCHEYRLMSRSLPSMDGLPTAIIAAVMIHGRFVAEGRGSSGKSAKSRASEHVLQDLGGFAPFEYRKAFGCDCKTTAADSGEPEESAAIH